MSDTEIDPSSTALSTTAQRVREGEIVAFDDLLKALEAVGTQEVEAAPPPNLPVKRALTDEETVALERVKEVFCGIVPETKRVLTPVEIDSLMDERLTLDALAKMAEGRKEDIRTIVYNHLDSEIDADEEGEKPDRDSKGFYITAGKVRSAKAGKAFSREIRDPKGPSLTADSLKTCEVEGDDPPVYAQGEISHEDWLAMTTPIRVLDENKVMLALRSNPDLIHAIRRATTPGSATTAMFVRNAK